MPVGWQSRQMVTVMINKPRFIKTSSVAGAWFIKDKKDDSIVAIIQRGNRPVERTEAMVKVMLEALNTAVEKSDARNRNYPN